MARNALIDHARELVSRKKVLDGWVLNVLRATPSDSVLMEEEWTRRAPGANPQARAEGRPGSRISQGLGLLRAARSSRNRPAAEIARDLELTPNAVYVNACRVMKLVRKVCEEFEEDVSHAFESDLS